MLPSMHKAPGKSWEVIVASVLGVCLTADCR